MNISIYEKIKIHLAQNKYIWLVTGAAGFIGSNLVKALLKLNQDVIGIDNFSTNNDGNLIRVVNSITAVQANSFHFFEVDIREKDCKKIIEGVDFVLHHAALASVTESISKPELFNSVNVDGFLNILYAAKDVSVKRFVYASSSSVYGNVNEFPTIESRLSMQLSPYAVSKYVNELYALAFANCYSIDTIGLRYFNVFGPGQNSNGVYAAVIPRWINALLNGDKVHIYGDGNTSRDFCYIDDVVQANILAALIEDNIAVNTVYNIASGQEVSLNQLYNILCKQLNLHHTHPLYSDFRKGDIFRSLASINKAKTLLNFDPGFSLETGLAETIDWHCSKFNNLALMAPAM